MRARLAVVALLASAALGGCGVGSGSPEEGSAILTVTRDFGAKRLL